MNVGAFNQLFPEPFECTRRMDSNIKKIWASPPSTPPSPSSVIKTCPAIAGEDLSTLDQSLGLSVEEIFAQGPDVELPAFVEAVQVMRPHERFTMAKLTGLFRAGVSYYPCPVSNPDFWWLARSQGGAYAEKATETERQREADKEDEDDKFFVDANAAMVEWVLSQPQ